MAWQEVAKAVDVPEGEALQVRIGEEPIAIYNLAGTFYATHDICTHALAHLSDGYIDGDCVECPLHGGVFHIPSGQCRGGPVQKPVRIYPIRQERDVLFIDA
ncbi:non-heme iron oxygenase ferredoxin subunit [Pseudorhodoferax sp.]|uniref:non-heme iron oxygenase ferredoxin subunit n=1 Tax=Pseudorhodoferax sp. TaxID=1993553 RepID=UPI002DD67070|nr:non-heme iron oxygenase ferredoxin subunit [Pseudorhodoferax sp.]